MALLRTGLSLALVASLGVACSSKKAGDDDKSGKARTRTAVIAPPPAPVTVTCDDIGASAAAIWNDKVKSGLKSTVEALKTNHGDATFVRIARRFDARATQLAQVGKGSCDWRKALCLKRSASALAALLAELGKADGRIMTRALRATYRLPAVADCNDVAFVSAVPTPLADARAKVEKVYELIDRMRVRLHLGQSKGTTLELKAIVLGAQRIGYAPALAEALELQGRAFRAGSKLNHAQQSLSAAAKTAAGAPDHWRVASVWVELVSVLVDARRIADAYKVVTGAEAAIARSHNTATLRRRLHEATAMAHFHTGKHAAAVASADKALALIGADDAIASAGVLFLRAAAMQADKKHSDAQKVYVRLQTMVSEAFGPQHPMVGRVLIARGNSQVAMGSVEEGIKTLGEAVQSFANTYGAEHGHVASARSALARAYLSGKKFKEALAQHEQVLAIRTKVGGAMHLGVGKAQLDLARTRQAAGDVIGAKSSAIKARQVFEQAKSKGGVAAAQKLLDRLAAP